jgi:hypothetical protein
MATVRVRIVILTVQITLSVCPFNCMAHTANSAWIKTKKGIQRVTLEETSRGLGLQKGSATNPTVSLVENTTSIFHWEYLSASVRLPGHEQETGPQYPCWPQPHSNNQT